MTEAVLPAEQGCPSKMAPPVHTRDQVDPSPFVTVRGDTKNLEFAITGATCAGCLSKIEGKLMSLPGMKTARLNLSTGKLRTEWIGPLSAATVTDTVTGLGYGAVPFDPEASIHDQDRHGRFLLRCLAVAGFSSANIMLLSVSVWATSGEEMGEATRSLLHLISALIAIPAVAYAGRPFFSSAWNALRHRHANMDVPISLALFLALGASLYESLHGGEHAYFDAAVMLLFFLLIGRWLDHRLRRRAQSAAKDLLALQATTAIRLNETGEAEPIRATDISVGDRLVLEPGRRLPVNAQVIEGKSDIDTAFLTGESEPRVAVSGDQLFAGTQNISQRLIVRSTADMDGSLVADLVRLVEAGQQTKDRYTMLADKAAKLYVPVVHSLAALTLVGWLILGDGNIREAVMAATAVLIITCPCALGLATPAVQVVATSQLFRKGVLVKSGNALERLAKVRHLVFDKTGTLTVGKMVWENPGDLTPEARKIVSSLARSGLHPIARAIAAQSGTGKLATDVQEIPGRGMTGVVDGLDVRLGDAEFVGGVLSEQCIVGPRAWLKIGDDYPIALKFSDQIRTDSAKTLESLKGHGLTIGVLSGDKSSTVEQVADALKIENWLSDLSPQDKVEAIEALRATGPVAMIGDGINDAPALALADVSLSPGTAADAAQSAADFVFHTDGIRAVYEAWRMAKRARRHILQNFGFAAAYNAVAAPMAMAGFVSPLIAALAMSGSSIVVTLNAMRLMREDPT